MSQHLTLFCLILLLFPHKSHTRDAAGDGAGKLKSDALLKLVNYSGGDVSEILLKTILESSTADVENSVETNPVNNTYVDHNWAAPALINNTYEDQNRSEPKLSDKSREEQLAETKKLHKRQTLEVTRGLQQMEASKPVVVVEEGYPFEEHSVTTSDGYILALHRIPGPRSSIPVSVSSRKPVFLMHGLFLSSTSFLALGPNKSLGYLLADAGYDVWMGNSRGNTYSRNHTTFDPDTDAKFWEFSQDEMAERDIPAMAGHILATTGARQLSYVGYSQGGRTGLMAAALPDLGLRMDVMVILASTGARTLLGGAALSSQLKGAAWRILESIGKREIVSYNLGLVQLLSKLCTAAAFLERLCTDIVSSYSGRNVIRDELYQFRKENLPLIFAHSFSGSSARQFSYQAQVSDGVLRKFDFKRSGNLEHYGSATPPEYNLTAIRCPVAIYWASNDQRTPIEDVKRISKEIPQVVRVHQIDSKSFNHLDFIFAEKAKSLLYDNVIDLLDQYR